MVTELFAVGDGGHYLLEVGLVVNGGRFRGKLGFSAAGILKGPPLFVEVRECNLAAV